MKKMIVFGPGMVDWAIVIDHFKIYNIIVWDTNS